MAAHTALDHKAFLGSNLVPVVSLLLAKLRLDLGDGYAWVFTGKICLEGDKLLVKFGLDQGLPFVWPPLSLADGVMLKPKALRHFVIMAAGHCRKYLVGRCRL